ncbi:MAG: hypothetical protein ACK4WH_14675 [Phycisphaerales bacterium]
MVIAVDVSEPGAVVAVVGVDEQALGMRSAGVDPAEGRIGKDANATGWVLS